MPCALSRQARREKARELPEDYKINSYSDILGTCLVVTREAAAGADLGDALQGGAAEAARKVAPGAAARHRAGAVVRAGRDHVRAALRSGVPSLSCLASRLQHLQRQQGTSCDGDGVRS